MVGHGNGSAAWIFRGLFRMRSKSGTETKEKLKKPKIANNSEARG